MTDPLFNLNGKKFILASTSPRRASLLKMLGIDFEVVDSNFEEKAEVFTIPEVHVLEFALKKAQRVADEVDGAFILGADTIVVLEDHILGKPEKPGEAKEFLARLSGKTHVVYTGFALVDQFAGRIINEYEKTKVTFREIDDLEIERYLKTGSPFDKAGAYGIQDEGAVFIEKIEGCFYNVMGLPLTRLYLAFRDLQHEKKMYA